MATHRQGALRHIVADLESDGLLDELTVIHSLVLRDMDGALVMSCTNSGDPAVYHSVESGLAVLAAAEKVYFHNGIKFDYPALRKVYPDWDMDRSKIRDTFVIASMRFAHIKDTDHHNKKLPGFLAGSHSLQAWGIRLGVWKGDYKGGWAAWSPEMQSYCEQDTATTKALVQYLRQAGGCPVEAVDTEHRLAWYLAAQERNGVPFDVQKATELQATLAGRRAELEAALVKHFGSWEQFDGTLIPKRDNKARGYLKGVAVTKTKTVQFNPGSTKHIAKVLTEQYGWKATAFTPQGAPQVDASMLKGLNQTLPGVKMIQEYLLVAKRLSQLSEGKEAWLRKCTTDGPEGGKLTGLSHIHGRVKQNGTVTHRASHVSPNLAQVPKVGNPYGAECRELFCVPSPEWVMIGADASGLEARVLGHYMARYDGGTYGKLLLEGDVHTANRIALGLPEGKAERDKAKTWYYAFIFGSGPEKSGTILSPGLSKAARVALGKEKNALFLNNTPALKYLIDSMKQKLKEPGYVTLADGRRTYIRSEHAALNSLIQSMGAVICKKWIVNSAARLESELGPQGWTGKWAALLWIHDELQLAVRREYVELVKIILVEEIQKLTQHFNWRLALDGEAKAGANWKETH